MLFEIKYTFKIYRTSSQRKHLIRWLSSLKKNYLLDKKQPWLVFDAVDFLNSLDLKGKRIFEYGSGGSTLFWMEKQTKCISVEHDPFWFNVIKVKLDVTSSVDYRLVLPEFCHDVVGFDPSDPNAYSSDDINFREYRFYDYVTQIEQFPDKYFDIVLVDGRARPSCIKHSSKKVKDGGYLIVDNSDRDYYFERTRVCFADFKEKKFVGVAPATMIFASTSFFIKNG